MVRSINDFYRIKHTNNIENFENIKNTDNELIEFTHFKIVPLNGSNNSLKNLLENYSNIDETFCCVKFYNNRNLVSEQLRNYNWCKNFIFHIRYPINDLLHTEI